MASSRGTSNGPDWLDLAELIAAFEEQNGVRVSLRMGLVTRGIASDLTVVGEVWDRNQESGEAKPLASQTVLCRRERFRTMEGLFTFLMYQLDFQLAELEWAKSRPGA